MLAGPPGEPTGDAMAFLMDLAPRLRNRVQITTDGHRPYIEAVEASFGKDVDYAMLIKFYGTDPNEGRFSPPKVLSEEVRVITGNPYPRTPAMAAGLSDHIWTCEEIAALLD